MSIIDGLLRGQKIKFTASILINDENLTDGQRSTPIWLLVKSFQCMFWKAGMKQYTMNSTFRTDVDAVILMRPEDVSANDFPAGCRISIVNSFNESMGVFTMTDYDNIGGQGKILQTTLKRVDI
jgi:hypothetical protein